METEVVLGTGEAGRPKACSSETESAKQDESGEKTLGEDFAQENGVKVSENGGEKILSDDDGNIAKEDVVETTDVNDSGVIEDCVMNGVSSLLKLKQDFSDKENLQEEKEINEDEEEGEDDEEEEEEEEEKEEEEHEYHVGDFVWGKIKNHPWWPGQIYDPSDASDLALKIKQKGKLLVAYFGDGTFAWCSASQLQPFAESFKECSKISSTRGFLVAVEEAVEEMGRHIEHLLISDSTEEEKQKLDNPTPEAKNAGIKVGVIVRDVRREMISSLVVGKPEEILKDVRTLAETLSYSSLLELEILKREISVFYQAKSGYGLTEYHEAQPVPGLEDKNDDSGLKWRAKRSRKEEEKKVVELEESHSHQLSLVKCSGFPDNRQQHRRKQKSIADILENESAAKVRYEAEPAHENEMSGRIKVKCGDKVNGEPENVTITTPRMRKMSEVSTIEDAGRKKVEVNGKNKTLSRKKKRKRRDADVDDSGDENEDREESAHKGVIEKNKVSDLEIDIDSTPLASLRKRVRVDSSNVEKNSGNAETATQTSKRERKKSKYFSSDYLSDFSWKGRKKSKTETESSKVSSERQVGEQMTDAIGSELIVTGEEDKLDKPCEPSDDGLGHQELSDEVSNAVDFLRLGATPTEMRDLIRVAALGTQYPKDSSSRDMVREFMSIYRSFTYNDGTNSKFLGIFKSPDEEKEEYNETGKPKTKGKERKYKKRKAKQHAEEIEQIGKEENETTEQQAAEEIEQIEKEENETTKKERKAKKPKSTQHADEVEETGTESKKERKLKKPRVVEEETPEEPSEIEKPDKEKKKKKREGKSKKKRETEEEVAGADLFVTFGPGSSLPKKEELIEIYGKFGALDEERTYMFYNNFCARVAFLNVTDGEKAFESSQEKCPFDSNSTVSFRLKYPTNERTKEKKAEAEEETMKMEYVKRKLEEMRSLVDESEGGMIEEVKRKLEDEMVNLLEKVRELKSF